MSAKTPSFPSHTHSFYPLPSLPSSTPPFNTDNAKVHLQMDPSVPRTFFPYIPNEVKHRKRTSRHQLKVLEEVFRKDTKPNAVLRKKLATELEMSPRAVQVWFQNRRAKEKANRKRASTAITQDKPASPSTKKSPSRDLSPNDSSNSSTATEKPACGAEDDLLAGLPSDDLPPSHTLKVSCSPPLIPVSPPSAWSDSTSTLAVVPPHIRPPTMVDPMAQDPDLYSARRGSLPAVMPSQPFTGPSTTQSSIHFPDRRNSMDVSVFKLVHHPFARFAKEKNEALYMSKSPLSPAGTTQANLTRLAGAVPGIGPIRTSSHGYRANLSHRASEPQVFAPLRTLFPPVPETGALQPPPAPSRRLSDNRLYAITSRPLASPIPGPLPTPDFQFGNPSSGSPSNGSPTPGEVESPPMPLQSPDIAQLQRWSFPRPRETDQDTEDSGSYSGLSRFGSVASVSGSDSSAIYSDVSSCVAADHIGYDPTTRRGSCASGSYLEMRLSGLSMSARSSQGSFNEAHLAPPTGLAYRDKLPRQERSPEMIGGYASPASTASPGTTPHVRQVAESPPSVIQGDSIYECSPVRDLSPVSASGSHTHAHKLSQVPENDEIVTRRGSMQAQEPLPQPYVQNHLEIQGPYPTPPSEARGSSVQPAVQQSHYSHGGSFVPPGSFSHTTDPSFVPTSRSGQAEPIYQQQSSQLQYSPQGTFQGASSAVAMPHSTMSRYAPPSNEYTYTAGHEQEPYPPLT